MGWSLCTHGVTNKHIRLLTNHHIHSLSDELLFPIDPHLQRTRDLLPRMIPHQRLLELFDPLRRPVRHDENIPEPLPLLRHPDLSNAFDDLIYIGVTSPLERVFRSLGPGTICIFDGFYVFVDRPRLDIQSSERKPPRAQFWTVAFEVSSSDVEGEEAGYGWVSKFWSWRRDHGRESEEVSVGLKGFFDERGPAKEFDYGAVEEDGEAVVDTPSTEHTERIQGGS